MKTIFILFLFTISFSAFGQKDRDFKMYYKSGKIKAEMKWDSSCNCNRLTEYFESGKVSSIRQSNGKLEGADINYFEDGTIDIYYFWKDGAPSGRIYANYADGKLAYEKYFSNKFKTGTWKVYNEDGTLKKETIYEENTTAWDSNDDYATEQHYYNNKLAYTLKLVAGRKTKLTVINKDSYEKLMALEPPLGRKLYVQNCAPCHHPNKESVGPKMKGITNRRTNSWLQKMIINGNALIESGDKEAVLLYEKYNKISHPNFERLSEKEVNALIDYLKTLK